MNLNKLFESKIDFKDFFTCVCHVAAMYKLCMLVAVLFQIITYREEKVGNGDGGCH